MNRKELSIPELRRPSRLQPGCPWERQQHQDHSATSQDVIKTREFRVRACAMHVCGPSASTPQHIPQPWKDGMQNSSNYMELEQQNKTKQSPPARAGAMARQVRALAEGSPPFPAPTWQLTSPSGSSSSNDFFSPPLAPCPHVQTNTRN